MFERPKRGERAVLLHVRVDPPPYREDADEFRSLLGASGAELAGELKARLRTVNPKFLIGRGKLEELRELMASTDADLVVIDHLLTPAQGRNLERELKRRVVDRTDLILDIFALRARTFEGKLQVELAQLEHLSTRLVRGWTHLERQKGGIGLRGPGETQLETDRRLLDQRIRRLRARLGRLSNRRGLARQKRSKHEVPTISLVGYTNAGKSTLFNKLTDGDVYVADQLFATLDPTLRRVALPLGGEVVLADTVGFVRDLPHELVAAFASTLEEAVDADLLLHVVDCSDPDHIERIEDVEAVLRQIGAADRPLIQVYNKTDILAVEPRVDRSEDGAAKRVWLSSVSGAGINVLMDLIADALSRDRVSGTVRLSVAQSRLRALLYERATIISERTQVDGGWELDVEIDIRWYRDLHQNEKLTFSTSGDDSGSAFIH